MGNRQCFHSVYFPYYFIDQTCIMDLYVVNKKVKVEAGNSSADAGYAGDESAHAAASGQQGGFTRKKKDKRKQSVDKWEKSEYLRSSVWEHAARFEKRCMDPKTKKMQTWYKAVCLMPAPLTSKPGELCNQEILLGTTGSSSVVATHLRSISCLTKKYGWETR